MRRAFFAVLTLVVILAGCVQATPSQLSEPSPKFVEATASASSTVPALLPRTPTALKPNVPASPAAPQPSTARTPTSAPTPPKSNVPAFVLKVTTPPDESTVNAASIAVAGQTIIGAVVSVNGNLVDVDASGKFQTTVQLDEGPNIIEVVASDVNGNELSAILRVIYEP
jgi:Glucodextranase, domain B